LFILGQSGLSLPDEAYYREDTYAEIRTAFTAHIAKMFSLSGLPNGDAAAKLILEFKTEIASLPLGSG
jgi:putative endopeptidase